MTTLALLLLITISVLAAVSHATNQNTEFYDAHLYRSDGTQYDHGSGIRAKEIMRTIELPRIQQKWSHGTCTILIHGIIGSGKSSIIERLMGDDQLAISSGINFQANQPSKPYLGHTKVASAYQLNSNHANRFIVIDTPGLDEIHDAAKVDVQNAVREALQRLSPSALVLDRFYFVIDPTARDCLSKIRYGLQKLRQLYGDEICKKMRLVINKSDQLASEGPLYIQEIVKTCHKEFREIFGIACSKIIFTCSNIASRVCCIGQLIDDICSNENDTISLDVAQVDERVQQSTRQLQDRISTAAFLDSHSSNELRQLCEQERSKKIKLDNELSCSRSSHEQAQAQLSNQKHLLQALQQVSNIAASQGFASVYSEADQLCQRFRLRSHAEILFFTQEQADAETDLAKILRSWLVAVKDFSYTDVVSLWEVMNPQTIDQKIQDLQETISKGEEHALATEQTLQLKEEEIRKLEDQIHLIHERL